MSKMYIGLQKWTDDYDGAAIYSLVDQDGKRYIGQAIHLQKRLETHRIELNRIALNSRCTAPTEGMKLIQAVKNGSRFKVEILKKIPWNDTTVNILRYWEYHYLMLFGGFENTYNTGAMPSPIWNYDPFNEVNLRIDFTDSDILEHLKGIGNKQGYVKDLIRQDIKEKRPQ